MFKKKFLLICNSSQVERSIKIKSRSIEQVPRKNCNQKLNTISILFIIVGIAGGSIIMNQRRYLDQFEEKYSVEALTKFHKFKQPKQFSPTLLLKKLTATLLTSAIAHQLIYVFDPSNQRVAFTASQGRSKNWQVTRRPTEHTATIFSIKILMDHLEQLTSSRWSEYFKGGSAGMIGFLLGRPFDQMDLARFQIFSNQKKSISRIEAFRVILRQDGTRGFYKHENLLGPIAVMAYFSAYFGLWDRLKNTELISNVFLSCIIYPFGASLGASIASFLPEKCRRFCFQASIERSQALQKKYRPDRVELKAISSSLMEFIGSPEFKISGQQLKIMGNSVMKNWLILTLFAGGQICAEHKS